MKKAIAALSIFAALSACGDPISLFVRAGTSDEAKRDHLTNCQIEATNRVKPNVVTIPMASTINAQTYCTGAGCTTYGTTSPSAIAVDQNDVLRGRAVIQCMKKLGYEWKGRD